MVIIEKIIVTTKDIEITNKFQITNEQKNRKSNYFDLSIIARRILSNSVVLLIKIVSVLMFFDLGSLNFSQYLLSLASLRDIFTRIKKSFTQ